MKPSSYRKRKKQLAERKSPYQTFCVDWNNANYSTSTMMQDILQRMIEDYRASLSRIMRQEELFREFFNETE